MVCPDLKTNLEFFGPIKLNLKWKKKKNFAKLYSCLDNLLVVIYILTVTFKKRSHSTHNLIIMFEIIIVYF